MTATAPGTGAVGAGAPLALALDDVTAGYGPFRAVFRVSLDVPAGTATALLGPNGAGKTTIARVCTGLIRPRRGRVRLGDEDVTGRRPYRLARLGVAHAPEGRSVFATLTVEENLSLALRRGAGRAAVAGGLAEVYERFPKLGDRRSQTAGTLSGGEQRLLSLAPLLVRPPRLLVVDELSLGLAPIIVEEVYRHLAELKARGTTMLVIEQHVEQAFHVADQVVVLDRGRVTYRGRPGSVDELAALMLPDRAAR